MASVILTRSDLALFSDPGNTRVVIPHLIAAPRTRNREQATVRFEGDEYDTVFRGQGRSRTYDLTCRYGQLEHGEMAQLVELLEDAHDAPDGRLQLRTHFFDVPGLQPYEVVTVGQFTEQHLGAKAWDVKFSATTVQHTIAV